MHLSVDTDRLVGSGIALSAAADLVAAEADALARTARGLRSDWVGSAHSAWSSRHAAVEADIRRKAALLRHAAQRLTQYARDIVEADTDAARAIIGL